MVTGDNLFSSAAGHAGALSKAKLSSMGWLSGIWSRGRASTDRGWRLDASTPVEVRESPQHALWQELYCLPMKTDKEREKSHQMPLVETSLASTNSVSLSETLDWASKGFCQGPGSGERSGSILLQPHPFCHSLLGYFSGNELPTHKEAKY